MGRKSDNLVLLITGCISPNSNQQFLELIDPDERLEQYIESMKYYLIHTDIQKIVFCENSKTTFDASELFLLAQERKKDIEILSFQGDVDKTVSKGKGYGEGEIVDYALSNSKLLCGADVFAKVTGRLKITNINKIVRGIGKGNYLNSDIYRINALDTRFYICDTDYYNRSLRTVYVATSYDHGRALEDLFQLTLSNNHQYKCTKYYPRFEGASGGSGRNYSKESKLKLFWFDILCYLGIFNSVYQAYSKSVFRKAIWHFWGDTKK